MMNSFLSLTFKHTKLSFFKVKKKKDTFFIFDFSKFDLRF